MRTNGTATLYLLQSNETYTRTVVPVFWVPKTKMVPSTDGVTLRVVNIVYVPLVSGLTISTRDYIVPGEITKELSSTYTVRDLLIDYQAQAVTGVAKYDLGAADLQHWELEVA